MNPILMTNAQFYFTLSVPLTGILVNAVLILMLNGRVSRVEDRLHRLEDRVATALDMLIGKINEIDVRLARLEERLAK
jgi:hypothetical protein